MLSLPDTSLAGGRRAEPAAPDAPLLELNNGEVTDGEILLRGQSIAHRGAADIVRLGLSLVMEGRRVFEHLTVHENLVAGGYTRGIGARGGDVDLVYRY